MGEARWGYHELCGSHARALVHHAGIQPADLVVDLGAGTGAITRQLLKAGAQVIAVELHAGRAAELRRRLQGQHCRVIQADICEFSLPDRPFRVVANPPFAVLATMLRRLTGPRSRMTRADLVVPSHVAGRWTRGAHPATKRYGAAVTRRLGRDAFNPPATQPVAVLSLSRRR